MYGKFKPMHCTNFNRFYKENILSASLPTQVRHLDIYSTVFDIHNYVIISLPIQGVSVYLRILWGSSGKHSCVSTYGGQTF